MKNMVDHSKVKKNQGKMKNHNSQEKNRGSSQRMKGLRKKQSLLRMVQSGAGCYNKGPLTPIVDESPTTSQCSTPVTVKKLEPLAKYVSDDEVKFILKIILLSQRWIDGP